MPQDRLAAVRALVLEGGGIKGLAYLGFLRQLESHLSDGFRQIEQIPATSAGAITGALIAAGATTSFRHLTDSPSGLLRDAFLRAQPTEP